MIEINNLSFRYNKNENEILKNINLKINKGDCVLLCGKSGSGKTTITKLINGLIPHFYENCILDGQVIVDGHHTRQTEMYQLAAIVGSVFQNPKSQFFYLDSNSELVFIMENTGMDQDIMKERTTHIIEDLNIHNLLNRQVFHMSGGEKQTLAFASSYIGNPDILVLDEPSANLDYQAIIRLKEHLLVAKNKGKTIVIAEHRLWFLKDIVDRVIYVKDGSLSHEISANEFFDSNNNFREKNGLRNINAEEVTKPIVLRDGELQIKDLCYSIIKKPILENITFSAKKGEVLGITGFNGSGKTTLIRLLSGLLKANHGNIYYNDKIQKQKALRKQVFLVMQDTNHQLFTESVISECRLGNSSSDEDIRNVLIELGLYECQNAHPMSLSGGQKQRLAIVSAILSKRSILIFDEPTSGLDYQHMYAYSRIMKEQAQKGKIVIIVSHDNEFLNLCANRIYSLEGRLE